MKVLCAVDGSQFSHWAVEALGALAGQRPGTVILLHTVETAPSAGGTARDRAGVNWSQAAMDKEGGALLGRMAQAAAVALSRTSADSRAAIRSVLAHGRVAETITRQAARRRADLLLLGSRGLSDTQGFLLGSVSRKVLSLAPCPVLVVKRRLSEFTRVVLAVDGSKHSRAAGEFLRTRLLPESAHLTVLSVVPPVVTDLAARVLTPAQLKSLTGPAEERARRLTEGFREAFLKDGFAVTADVLSGRPSQTIIQHAERIHADLVVVGSRGLTGSERLLLGSVSESVIKYASCSVLVVRKGRA